MPSDVESVYGRRSHLRSHSAKSRRKQATPMTIPARDYEELHFKNLSKDKDILKLKQELAFVKMMERKHQKELEALAQQDDAPRIIKALHEELDATRAKLKECQSLKTSEDRTLRHYTERCHALLEANERYRSLVEEKSLESRENLTKELEKLKEENQLLSKQVEDLQKVNVMSNKNLNKENQSLRSKIKLLEKDIADVKEKLEHGESIIREKEKQLGSYLMYRHKMVHDTELECKNCKKRAKEEQERLRKQKIREKLPKLEKPRHHISSATSIQIHISLPPREEGKVEYDQIIIRWAEGTGTEWKQLGLKPNEHEQILTAQIDDLKTHQKYKFLVCSSKEQEESEPTELHATVDLRPNAPPMPSLRSEGANFLTGSAAQISLEIYPSPVTQGSIVTNYIVYHSVNSNDFVNALKLGVIEASNEAMEFVYEKPLQGATHYFWITAHNAAYESDPSPVISCMVDRPPNRIESRPKVHRSKFAEAAILLTEYATVPDGCSDVTGYRVLWYPSNTTSSLNSLNQKRDIVPSTAQFIDVFNPHASRIHIPASKTNLVVQKHVYHIQAWNQAGLSPLSPGSQPVKLESLLCAPMPPTFDVTGARSVTLGLSGPDLRAEDGGPVAYIRQNVSKIRVWASRNMDMSDAYIATTFTTNNPVSSSKTALNGGKNGSRFNLKGNTSSNTRLNLVVKSSPSSTPRTSLEDISNGKSLQSTVNLDQLDYAGTYYFTTQYIGVNGVDESAHSYPPVQVTLAAAVPLPPATPDPELMLQQQQQQTNQNLLRPTLNRQRRGSIHEPLPPKNTTTTKPRPPSETKRPPSNSDKRPVSGNPAAAAVLASNPSNSQPQPTAASSGSSKLSKSPSGTLPGVSSKLAKTTSGTLPPTNKIPPGTRSKSVNASSNSNVEQKESANAKQTQKESGKEKTVAPGPAPNSTALSGNPNAPLVEYRMGQKRAVTIMKSGE